jgi:hypothetical protein
VHDEFRPVVAEDLLHGQIVEVGIAVGRMLVAVAVDGLLEVALPRMPRPPE